MDQTYYPSLDQQTNEKLCQKLGQYTKNLIEEVSRQLTNFLQSLTNLYKQYGINFTVKQNYLNLMRILTPFELLSKFQMGDDNQILSSEIINKMVKSITQEQQQGNQDQQNEQNIVKNAFNYRKNQKIGSYERLLPTKTSDIMNTYRQKSMRQKYDIKQPEMKIKQKEETKYKMKSTPLSIQDVIRGDPSALGFRKCGSKKQNMGLLQNNRNFYARQALYKDGPKIRPPSWLRKQLKQWAMTKLREKKVLTHRDILIQAKYIGRNIPNLALSPSWSQKFLHSHHDLYALYKKCKKENKKQEIRFTYSKQASSNGDEEYDNKYSGNQESVDEGVFTRKFGSNQQPKYSQQIKNRYGFEEEGKYEENGAFSDEQDD